jgi:hypothetical protein
MRSKANEDPQPPSKLRPDLDPHLEEIILHAIERQPRSRYTSAAEMLEDLRDPSRVVVTGRSAHLHPRSLRTMAVKRVLWTAFFFVSLIAIFGVLIWLANRYPASPVQPRGTYRGQVK